MWKQNWWISWPVRPFPDWSGRLKIWIFVLDVIVATQRTVIIILYEPLSLTWATLIDWKGFPGVGWVCCWFSSLLWEVFSGYSGFPLSSKSNNSKFQFDLDYCQALYHEPLAGVIPQALPVFDIRYSVFYILQIYSPNISLRETLYDGAKLDFVL